MNVGDVFTPDGAPRVRVRIRPEIAKGGRAADVFLPDRLVPKLKRFWRFKVQRGESLDADSPLFCNQSRRRVSKLRVQFAWRTWQMKTGLDRLYGFHALRHSAVTNVYRAMRDLFLAQRFARHVSPVTTVVYTHPSDEEMSRRIRKLACRDRSPIADGRCLRVDFTLRFRGRLTPEACAAVSRRRAG